MPQPRAVRPNELGPYTEGWVEDAALKGHRLRVQTQIGLAIGVTALASLVIAVGLIAYLAIDRREAEFIESVAQSLQPFILPTLGALVGYALREYQESGS